jgi:hypothetical protein
MSFVPPPMNARLLRGGLVLIDPATSAIVRVISLQYNPDTITRTLQVQSAGEGGARSEALRLKGPAVETFKVEAELDAIDQLEHPEREQTTARLGLAPQIALLESLIEPTSGQLLANRALSREGTLEIVPMQTALPVFVWSPDRIVPVRVTDLTVTEEAYDTRLHPIRARVSLGLRVLTVSDLGYEHRGGSLFMVALQAKEALARLVADDQLTGLGVSRLP